MSELSMRKPGPRVPPAVWQQGASGRGAGGAAPLAGMQGGDRRPSTIASLVQGVTNRMGSPSPKGQQRPKSAAPVKGSGGAIPRPLHPGKTPPPPPQQQQQHPPKGQFVQPPSPAGSKQSAAAGSLRTASPSQLSRELMTRASSMRTRTPSPGSAAGRGRGRGVPLRAATSVPVPPMGSGQSLGAGSGSLPAATGGGPTSLGVGGMSRGGGSDDGGGSQRSSPSRSKLASILGPLTESFDDPPPNKVGSGVTNPDLMQTQQQRDSDSGARRTILEMTAALTRDTSVPLAPGSPGLNVPQVRSEIIPTPSTRYGEGAFGSQPSISQTASLQATEGRGGAASVPNSSFAGPRGAANGSSTTKGSMAAPAQHGSLSSAVGSGSSSAGGGGGGAPPADPVTFSPPETTSPPLFPLGSGSGAGGRPFSSIDLKGGVSAAAAGGGEMEMSDDGGSPPPSHSEQARHLHHRQTVSQSSTQPAGSSGTHSPEMPQAILTLAVTPATEKDEDSLAATPSPEMPSSDATGAAVSAPPSVSAVSAAAQHAALKHSLSSSADLFASRTPYAVPGSPVPSLPAAHPTPDVTSQPERQAAPANRTGDVLWDAFTTQLRAEQGVEDISEITGASEAEVADLARSLRSPPLSLVEVMKVKTMWALRVRGPGGAGETAASNASNANANTPAAATPANAADRSHSSSGGSTSSNGGGAGSGGGGGSILPSRGSRRSPRCGAKQREREGGGYHSSGGGGGGGVGGTTGFDSEASSSARGGRAATAAVSPGGGGAGRVEHIPRGCDVWDTVRKVVENTVTGSPYASGPVEVEKILQLVAADRLLARFESEKATLPPDLQGPRILYFIPPPGATPLDLQDLASGGMNRFLRRAGAKSPRNPMEFSTEVSCVDGGVSNFVLCEVLAGRVKRIHASSLPQSSSGGRGGVGSVPGSVEVPPGYDGVCIDYEYRNRNTQQIDTASRYFVAKRDRAIPRFSVFASAMHSPTYAARAASGGAFASSLHAIRTPPRNIPTPAQGDRIGSSSRSPSPRQIGLGVPAGTPGLFPLSAGVIPAEEGQRVQALGSPLQQRGIMCIHHEQEEMRLYCVTEKELTCALCASIGRHAGKHCVSLASLLQGMRGQFVHNESVVERRLSNLQADEARVRSQEQAVRDATSQSLNALQLRVRALHDELDAKEQVLTERIRRKEEQSVLALTLQHKDIETQSASLYKAQSCLRSLLEASEDDRGISHKAADIISLSKLLDQDKPEVSSPVADSTVAPDAFAFCQAQVDSLRLASIEREEL